MSNYYNPHHPNVFESPKICCCIPIKFIILVMQAAALIWQICYICFGESASDKASRFLQIILAVYIGFTFVVFLINHRFLMCTHFCLAICGMMIPLGLFFFHFFSIVFLWIVGKKDSVNGELYVLLFKTAFVLFVILAYIVMCKTLIDSLNNLPLLPQYTTTQNVQQQGRVDDGPSEGTQLIYSVYPKL